MDKVLGIILAGGKGERLYPLTKERSKPAVPFGGQYRIVDFVLSNFINSGIFSIYILVQYLSQSLIEYLRTSWRGVGITHNHFITVVPPQMRRGAMWYQGTADAVRQNLNIISDHNPDFIAVFGADHIYRMDIRQMLAFHRACGADITVAAVPVPLADAVQYGVVETDERNKMTGFTEKPQNPKPMPGRKTHAYSSMGNYIFNRDVLNEILSSGGGFAGKMDLDFGRSILPVAFERYKVFAYDFSTHDLPGLRNYEEQSYWRDIGAIKAYWDAHMDLLGPQPRFNLNNPRWPIHSGRVDVPPANILNSKINNCIIGSGASLGSCEIESSVLGQGVTVGANCDIRNCVIHDFTEIGTGSRLKGVIVDRFNKLPPSTSIGYDPQQDSSLWHVDSSGIIVVPRGKTKP
ncbi:MAG: glucose-1-phosphate adenylyltransferase [Elusimicrobia bacterium]|nr:glucose-1-phosphate adenylyltransferase [Elusimicrobiota bacterium]